MAIVKRIVHFLSNICYFLILIYVTVCIPMLFRYYPIVVLSGSMEPAYKVGSVVYYEKVSTDMLKVGDTIVFPMNEDSRRMVCHRIIKIENGYITTKGDANKQADATKVSLAMVKGRVAKLSIIYIGYYIQFVNQHLGIVIVSAVIILVSEFLFSNSEIFDINKEERSERHGRKKKK